MPKKDPSADVDGLDTARKICILASIVSGRSVRLRDCRAIEGIRGICRHTGRQRCSAIRSNCSACMKTARRIPLPALSRSRAC